MSGTGVSEPGSGWFKQVSGEMAQLATAGRIETHQSPMLLGLSDGEVLKYLEQAAVNEIEIGVLRRAQELFDQAEDLARAWFDFEVLEEEKAELDREVQTLRKRVKRLEAALVEAKRGDANENPA